MSVRQRPPFAKRWQFWESRCPVCLLLVTNPWQCGLGRSNYTPRCFSMTTVAHSLLAPRSCNGNVFQQQLSMNCLQSERLAVNGHVSLSGCVTAIHFDGCWSTKPTCLHCIQRSRGLFLWLKLEIGSHLNFSFSFWLKIIDLILFIQTAPKPSRGGPALLLCQWLMCRLYYILDFLVDTSARILLSI